MEWGDTGRLPKHRGLRMQTRSACPAVMLWSVNVANVRSHVSLDDTITPVSRALRLIAASTATVSVPLFSLGLVVVGRGKRLEDACTTEPPPQWASEFTVIRGPLTDGLTTFRCVKVASPEDPFVFTDRVPLVMGVIVTIAAVSFLAVVWMWALRPSRNPLSARQPEPQDPPREPHK